MERNFHQLRQRSSGKCKDLAWDSAGLLIFLAGIGVITKYAKDIIRLEDSVIIPASEPSNAKQICETGRDKVKEITGGICSLNLGPSIDAIRASCAIACAKSSDTKQCEAISGSRLNLLTEQANWCKYHLTY